MTEPRRAVRLPRKLGELGVPVEVLPLGTSFADVMELLQAEPLLPGVLIASGGHQIMLSRARAEQLTMGPLGFGAALTSRRIIEPADGLEPLALPSDTDVDLAAQAALARPIVSRDEPIVVCWRDGRCGIAPVIGLLTAMAGRYARLARADQLTGLPNRSAALTEGRQRLEDGELAAVLHLGLDRFQDANDMLGTQGADVLLQRVAAELRAACRAEDLTARLEGDQFVVLLAEPAPAEGLITIARRLADALRGPHTVNGIPVSIETSIGIAATDHREFSVVLRRAADAVRTAKRDRVGVVLWTADTVSTHRADLRQLTELRTGIRSGHLRLHYQPQVCARTREIHGFEALVRWQHPQRGELPPGVFLPDAERSDVILELTDWVLAEAIHQSAVWHQGGADMPVSVNLPAAYLAQERAVPTVLALLALEQLPARLLTLELTETAVLARPDEAAARLTSMRAAGIRVSIDDFGTGYTSLGLLPELPIDELKIDRSFVARMLDSQARATIIHSIIAIARSLDLTVVAEGIEDEPTAAALAAAGVDLLQGYHLGRPAPAPEFTQNSGDQALQTPLVRS
ncbi:bifunctional diguanylate cyclase/phosphodiesterase [Actinoplanes bogorensis]|uniref:Bifunctional diguanylate cyclase/phosphodiesterase n=1 Tax=Paractinoplanes bogorensis TaxID=1610840 RepID=A0ABS5YIU6_9ACTN|nr:bifunctional diguanylate cyclase/phosphodiesterase [Actinoplanes bogorensis]MBU2663402.1 bifunctional diguanylate cyclase/phosphodiesterase [Actinoplanes bogorensis]